MIDLEWRPIKQSVEVGDTVRIGIYAVSDNDAEQRLAAIRVILKWDPTCLQLLGVDDWEAPSWAFSGFPPDAFFINEVVLPQDGNGIYEGWGKMGKTVVATPTGSLMTHFEFEALEQTERTRLRIMEKMRIDSSLFRGYTKVYDGFVPNKDVLRKRGRPARVEVASEPD